MIPVSAAVVVLLAVGASLLVAELFTPSFGFVGVVGGVLVFLGVFLLVDPSGFAERSFDAHWPAVWALCLVALLFAALAGWKVAETRRRPETGGAAALVGQMGQALSRVTEREGTVRVHGELWEARSTVSIEPDAPIRVESVEGLVLRVQPDASSV